MIKFKKVTLEEVYAVVNSVFDLDIKVKTNKRKYAYARSIFYKIVYDNSKLTFEIMADFLSQKHSSAVHAVARLDNIFLNDEDVLVKYKNCLELIGLKADKDINVLRLVSSNKNKSIESIKLEHKLEIKKIHDSYKNNYKHFNLIPDRLKDDFYNNRLIPYLKMNGLLQGS